MARRQQRRLGAGDQAIEGMGGPACRGTEDQAGVLRELSADRVWVERRAGRGSDEDARTGALRGERPFRRAGSGGMAAQDSDGDRGALDLYL